MELFPALPDRRPYPRPNRPYHGLAMVGQLLLGAIVDVIKVVSLMRYHQTKLTPRHTPVVECFFIPQKEDFVVGYADDFAKTQHLW